MTRTNQNADRLKQLVLYVAERCAHLERFGKVKLNKILYLADMRAYLETGKTLTGCAYVKEQFGPVPRGMDTVLAELVEAGMAKFESRTMPDLKTQQRLVPKRGPNLASFTYDELKVVEGVIDFAKLESAHDLSEWTHEFAGWRAARMGEEIPAFTALLPNAAEPLTQAELEHGRALNRAEAALTATVPLTADTATVPSTVNEPPLSVTGTVPLTATVPSTVSEPPPSLTGSAVPPLTPWTDRTPPAGVPAVPVPSTSPPPSPSAISLAISTSTSANACQNGPVEEAPFVSCCSVARKAVYFAAVIGKG